MGQLVLKIQK